MAFTSLPQAIISVPVSTAADLAALAHDLLLDEPSMKVFEARSHATELLDELDAYAASWDCWAFLAGNDAALII